MRSRNLEKISYPSPWTECSYGEPSRSTAYFPLPTFGTDDVPSAASTPESAPNLFKLNRAANHLKPNYRGLEIFPQLSTYDSLPTANAMFEEIYNRSEGAAEIRRLRESQQQSLLVKQTNRRRRRNTIGKTRIRRYEEYEESDDEDEDGDYDAYEDGRSYDENEEDRDEDEDEEEDEDEDEDEDIDGCQLRHSNGYKHDPLESVDESDYEEQRNLKPEAHSLRQRQANRGSHESINQQSEYARVAGIRAMRGSVSEHGFQIDRVIPTEGHIAAIAHNGHYLVVFDAVPDHLSLTAVQKLELSRAVRNAEAAPSSIPSVLTFPVNDRQIVGCDFVWSASYKDKAGKSFPLTASSQSDLLSCLKKYEPNQVASCLPVLYLLITLSDRTLLSWKWNPTLFQFTFASRSDLPTDTLSLFAPTFIGTEDKTSSSSREMACVSARFIGSPANMLVWVECQLQQEREEMHTELQAQFLVCASWIDPIQWHESATADWIVSNLKESSLKLLNEMNVLNEEKLTGEPNNPDENTLEEIRSQIMKLSGLDELWLSPLVRLPFEFPVEITDISGASHEHSAPSILSGQCGLFVTPGCRCPDSSKLMYVTYHAIQRSILKKMLKTNYASTASTSVSLSSESIPWSIVNQGLDTTVKSFGYSGLADVSGPGPIFSVDSNGTVRRYIEMCGTLTSSSEKNVEARNLSLDAFRELSSTFPAFFECALPELIGYIQKYVSTNLLVLEPDNEVDSEKSLKESKEVMLKSDLSNNASCLQKEEQLFNVGNSKPTFPAQKSTSAIKRFGKKLKAKLKSSMTLDKGENGLLSNSPSPPSLPFQAQSQTQIKAESQIGPKESSIASDMLQHMNLEDMFTYVLAPVEDNEEKDCDRNEKENANVPKFLPLELKSLTLFAKQPRNVRELIRVYSSISLTSLLESQLPGGKTLLPQAVSIEARIGASLQDDSWSYALSALGRKSAEGEANGETTSLLKPFSSFPSVISGFSPCSISFYKGLVLLASSPKPRDLVDVESCPEEKLLELAASLAIAQKQLEESSSIDHPELYPMYDIENEFVTVEKNNRVTTVGELWPSIPPSISASPQIRSLVMLKVYSLASGTLLSRCFVPTSPGRTPSPLQVHCKISSWSRIVRSCADSALLTKTGSKTALGGTGLMLVSTECIWFLSSPLLLQSELATLDTRLTRLAEEHNDRFLQIINSHKSPKRLKLPKGFEATQLLELTVNALENMGILDGIDSPTERVQKIFLDTIGAVNMWDHSNSSVKCSLIESKAISLLKKLILRFENRLDGLDSKDTKASLSFSNSMSPIEILRRLCLILLQCDRAFSQLPYRIVAVLTILEDFPVLITSSPEFLENDQGALSALLSDIMTSSDLASLNDSNHNSSGFLTLSRLHSSDNFNETNEIYVPTIAKLAYTISDALIKNCPGHESFCALQDIENFSLIDQKERVEDPSHSTESERTVALNKAGMKHLKESLALQDSIARIVALGSNSSLNVASMGDDVTRLLAPIRPRFIGPKPIAAHKGVGKYSLTTESKLERDESNDRSENDVSGRPLVEYVWQQGQTTSLNTPSAFSIKSTQSAPSVYTSFRSQLLQQPTEALKRLLLLIKLPKLADIVTWFLELPAKPKEINNEAKGTEALFEKEVWRYNPDYWSMSSSVWRSYDPSLAPSPLAWQLPNDLEGLVKSASSSTFSSTAYPSFAKTRNQAPISASDAAYLLPLFDTSLLPAPFFSEIGLFELLSELLMICEPRLLFGFVRLVSEYASKTQRAALDKAFILSYNADTTDNPSAFSLKRVLKSQFQAEYSPRVAAFLPFNPRYFPLVANGRIYDSNPLLHAGGIDGLASLTNSQFLPMSRHGSNNRAVQEGNVSPYSQNESEHERERDSEDDKDEDEDWDEDEDGDENENEDEDECDDETDSNKEPVKGSRGEETVLTKNKRSDSTIKNSNVMARPQTAASVKAISAVAKAFSYLTDDSNISSQPTEGETEDVECHTSHDPISVLKSAEEALMDRNIPYGFPPLTIARHRIRLLLKNNLNVEYQSLKEGYETMKEQIRDVQPSDVVMSLYSQLGELETSKDKGPVQVECSSIPALWKYATWQRPQLAPSHSCFFSRAIRALGAHISARILANPLNLQTVLLDNRSMLKQARQKQLVSVEISLPSCLVVDHTNFRAEKTSDLSLCGLLQAKLLSLFNDLGQVLSSMSISLKIPLFALPKKLNTVTVSSLGETSITNWIAFGARNVESLNQILMKIECMPISIQIRSIPLLLALVSEIATLILPTLNLNVSVASDLIPCFDLGIFTKEMNVSAVQRFQHRIRAFLSLFSAAGCVQDGLDIAVGFYAAFTHASFALCVKFTVLERWLQLLSLLNKLITSQSQSKSPEVDNSSLNTYLIQVETLQKSAKLYLSDNQNQHAKFSTLARVARIELECFLAWFGTWTHSALYEEAPYQTMHEEVSEFTSSDVLAASRGITRRAKTDLTALRSNIFWKMFDLNEHLDAISIRNDVPSEQLTLVNSVPPVKVTLRESEALLSLLPPDSMPFIEASSNLSMARDVLLRNEIGGNLCGASLLLKTVDGSEIIITDLNSSSNIDPVFDKVVTFCLSPLGLEAITYLMSNQPRILDENGKSLAPDLDVSTILGEERRGNSLNSFGSIQALLLRQVTMGDLKDA